MSKDGSRSKRTSQGVIAVVLTSGDVVWEMKEMNGLEIYFTVEVTGLTDEMGKRETKEFLEMLLEMLLGLEE